MGRPAYDGGIVERRRRIIIKSDLTERRSYVASRITVYTNIG